MWGLPILIEIFRKAKKGENMGWVLLIALSSSVVVGFPQLKAYIQKDTEAKIEKAKHDKQFKELKVLTQQIVINQNKQVTVAQVDQLIKVNNKELAREVSDKTHAHVTAMVEVVIDNFDVLKAGDQQMKNIIKENIRKEPLSIILPEPTVSIVSPPTVADSGTYVYPTGLSSANPVYKTFDDESFMDYYMSDPVEKKKRGTFKRLFTKKD